MVKGAAPKTSWDPLAVDPCTTSDCVRPTSWCPLTALRGSRLASSSVTREDWSLGVGRRGDRPRRGSTGESPVLGLSLPTMEVSTTVGASSLRGGEWAAVKATSSSTCVLVA